MKRKIKAQIVPLIYIPILISTLVITLYYRSNYLYYISYLPYIAILPCLIVIITPLGNWRIDGEKSKPKKSWLHCLFSIILFELGMMICLLIQNKILFQKQFTKTIPSSLLNLIPQWLGANIGLFPWSLFAIMSIYFIYRSQNKSTLSPFSINILAKHRTFAANEIRRSIDVHIQFATLIFLALMTSFICISCLLLAVPNSIILNPNMGMLVTMLLMVLYQFKTTQNIIKIFETRLFPQGVQYLFIFFILIILCMCLTPIIRHLSTTFPSKLLSFHLNNSSKVITYQIWNTFWWLLATPLIVSLLSKLSCGRSARQLIVLVLIPPLVLFALFHFKQLSVIDIKAIIQSKITISLGFLTYLYILLQHDSTQLIWFGFIPIKSHKKNRYAAYQIVFFFTLMIIAVSLMADINSLLLTTLWFSFPIFIICCLP